MRINHRQIEAFRAVFQTGSMTAAGDLMGITQPAVSRLIRDLEAEVALKLFDRSAGKLAPTPDAVALFQEVQRSYHGLDRVADAAARLGRRRAGELRIAASVAPSFHGLPPVLTRFRASWPGVLLSLHTTSSPEVLDLVATRQCDLGIAVVPAEGPGVTIEPLPTQNAVCILPANHALASHPVIQPRDLSGVPMLMISGYSYLRQRIMQNFAAANIQPDIVFESSFSGPICSMVAEGMGVSVLDPLTARAYAGPTLAIRPFEPAVPYELKLIFPAGQPRSDRASAFATLLREQMEATLST
ncbi:MAG: LysR substrate-binding domain-containing protein [Rhodopila sp.]|nr:LysR substrate-binding domain-containing protein [Rhodopila sp.]